MLRIGQSLAIPGAALLMALVLYPTSASAQASRTWVSGVGDDANPCSRTAPCKTFAGAISKTAAGGEINCLDPGGFGVVTITKSITIDCTGTLGSILASSTTGVIVNGANVDVILRGLSINGGPPTTPGVNGVRFIQGNSLTIENSLIQNFTAANAFGIAFQPSVSARLYVHNTTLVNNGSGVTGGGVVIQPTGTAGASVLLADVSAFNNDGAGLLVDSTGNTGAGGFFVHVDNSRFSGSPLGISVLAPTGTTVSNVNVMNTTVSSSVTTGIRADGALARVRVSGSRISGNSTGIAFANGAFLATYLDNYLDGNGSAGAFSSTGTKQ